MAAIVGVALGLRLAVELVRPIVPVLMVAAVLASVIYVAWLLRRRQRDRW